MLLLCCSYASVSLVKLSSPFVDCLNSKIYTFLFASSVTTPSSRLPQKRSVRQNSITTLAGRLPQKLSVQKNSSARDSDIMKTWSKTAGVFSFNDQSVINRCECSHDVLFANAHKASRGNLLLVACLFSSASFPSSCQCCCQLSLLLQLTKCTVPAIQLFLQNCAQPHEDKKYVLPHINSMILSHDETCKVLLLLTWNSVFPRILSLTTNFFFPKIDKNRPKTNRGAVPRTPYFWGSLLPGPPRWMLDVWPQWCWKRISHTRLVETVICKFVHT